MKIYISIDGVLRNFINRFHYHYENSYINIDEKLEFNYEVNQPIKNDDLTKYFNFQSIDEKNYFQYVEYPMELYGHSPVSYNNVNNDLNKIVFDNPNHEIYLIGLDELGKAKPATFFFLSRNGFVVNNIKFITTKNIETEWETVDLWISDNKTIMDLKPENKEFILFSTKYNDYIETDIKITKLSDITNITPKQICLI